MHITCIFQTSCYFTDVHSHGDHAMGVSVYHWNPDRSGGIWDRYGGQAAVQDQVQPV